MAFSNRIEDMNDTIAPLSMTNGLFEFALSQQSYCTSRRVEERVSALLQKGSDVRSMASLPKSRCVARTAAAPLPHSFSIDDACP
jgi:hypothetical protein